MGAAEPYTTNVADVEPEQGLGPDEGWFDMRVQLLVNAARGGSSEVVFGRATFVPGAAHEWHRHPNAEEFFCLISGGGIALAGEREFRVGAGDVVFSPKNEWHGFRNDTDADAVMLWGWCGAADKASAGYEVAEPFARGKRSPSATPAS